MVSKLESTNIVVFQKIPSLIDYSDNTCKQDQIILGFSLFKIC